MEILPAAAIFIYVIITCLLVALAIYDYKYYILPDRLNAALFVCFVVFHILTGWTLVSPVQAALGVLAGGGLLLAIREAANRFYKEDALGLGDVKLMAAAGAGLGFPDVLLGLSLGAGLGLVHGLGMGLREKMKGGRPDFGRINVPAGLGLCAGIAIVMALQFGTVWVR